MTIHVCHALRCTTPTPEIVLMCQQHWAMCPPALMAAVVRAYRRGQEIAKTPSAEYVKAAMAAVHAVADLEGIQPTIQLIGADITDSDAEFFSDITYMADLVDDICDIAATGALLPGPFLPVEIPGVTSATTLWPPDHAAQLLKAWRTTNNATQGASA